MGKIGISDAILLERRQPDRWEFQIMKGHVQHGSDIIGGYPWLSDCLDVVLHHHEKYDGTGYITGLKGKRSHQCTDICRCGCFRRITSVRPYKRALTYDETMEIMRKGRGSHFDPDMIDGLLMMGEDLYREHISRRRRIICETYIKDEQPDPF